MAVAIARAGDTVDAVCWRELGRTAAVCEQVLNLNPNLATLGPVLPAGTPVVLPDLAGMAPAVADTVNLWD